MPAGNPAGYLPNRLQFEEAAALAALRQAPAVFLAGHLERPERRDVVKQMASRAKGVEGAQPFSEQELMMQKQILNALSPERRAQVMNIIGRGGGGMMQGPFAEQAAEQLPESIFRTSMLNDPIMAAILG